LKLNLVQKQSRLKVYNILPIPSFLYGCEIWTLKQRDIDWRQQKWIPETHNRMQFNRP